MITPIGSRNNTGLNTRISGLVLTDLVNEEASEDALQVGDQARAVWEAFQLHLKIRLFSGDTKKLALSESGAKTKLKCWRNKCLMCVVKCTDDISLWDLLSCLLSVYPRNYLPFQPAQNSRAENQKPPQADGFESSLLVKWREEGQLFFTMSL